jgi:hypothetical protein
MDDWTIVLEQLGIALRQIVLWIQYKFLIQKNKFHMKFVYKEHEATKIFLNDMKHLKIILTLGSVF